MRYNKLAANHLGFIQLKVNKAVAALMSPRPHSPRHCIGAFGADGWNWKAPELTNVPGSDMAEIVNLRIARKRAARSKADGHASEQRLNHGVSKSERERTSADRDKARQTLDQHQIEPGDRR